MAGQPLLPRFTHWLIAGYIQEPELRGELARWVICDANWPQEHDDDPVLLNRYVHEHAQGIDRQDDLANELLEAFCDWQTTVRQRA